MTEHEMMLMKALSAVVHMIEFMDTGNPLDVTATWASLNDADLQAWVNANSELLPLRRDHQTLYERLAADEKDQEHP